MQGCGVESGGGQLGVVGAERHPPDGVVVLDLEELLFPDGVPDADSLVAAGGGQPGSIVVVSLSVTSRPVLDA